MGCPPGLGVIVWACSRLALSSPEVDEQIYCIEPWRKVGQLFNLSNDEATAKIFGHHLNPVMLVFIELKKGFLFPVTSYPKRFLLRKISYPKVFSILETPDQHKICINTHF